MRAKKGLARVFKIVVLFRLKVIYIGLKVLD